MLGQSKYFFKHPEPWQVTITRQDGYAPNDADLEQVRCHMEKMLERGENAQEFYVPAPSMLQDEEPPDLHVVIAPTGSVLRHAVKPLQSHERIHR